MLAAAILMPEPTELARGQNEEELNRQRRAWIEGLHRTPPGVDWRSIEAANWRAHLDRRNAALASEGPPPPAWVEVGSVNLGGRTHQATLHAASHKLYLGSNLGGLWRGDFDPASPNPAAMNWQPLSDGVYGSAFQVAVLDGPPFTLLKTHAKSWGSEIHRSTDGGAIWTQSSGVVGRVRRMLALHNSEETVFAVADIDNQWACGATITSKLLRSRDRGATFQEIRDLGGSRADIWTSRTTLGPLYVLTDNRLEVSSDLGDTWAQVGTLPWTGPSRVALTASEAGAPTFYAIIQKNDCSGSWNLFRSTDGGTIWSALGTVSDFWGDNVSFSASTLNPNLLLYGGMEAWRSTNGGASFTRVNFWYDYYGNPAGKLHADIPAIDFASVSSTSEVLFFGTDGGTYYSTDGGATVHNISLDGLRVSQYYSTLSDVNDPRLIQAGSQDQGYQKGEAGFGSSFQQLISGDYGQLTSSSGTHNLVYSVYPGFLLVAERNGTATTLYGGDGSFTFPAEDHHWLPDLVADPLNANAVYLCARHLHRYLRSGNTWVRTQLPFDFANGSGDYASALGIAPADPNRRYVATSQGRLWYSTDAGGTWSLSAFTSVLPPQYLTGVAVLVDPSDPLTAYVGGSGYGNAPVYRSIDGGVSFEPFDTGLPSTLVFALAADPLGGDDVYAATESGPYRYVSAMGSWQSLLGSSAAPMTTYWSVERAGDRVRFGTYGRGIWDYVPPQPGCAFTLSPDEASFPDAGGTGVLNISTGDDCVWSVSRLDSWITPTSTTKGQGNGSVSYSVASNPSGVGRTGHLSVRDEVLTITQSIPRVSVSDATVLEGQTTSAMVFTLSMSMPSSRTITVHYATEDGTASGGSDYMPTSGTASFAPGATTAPVTVTVIGDTSNEPDETLFLDLSDPTNATLADAVGVGTIVDDDVTLSVTAQGTGAGTVTSAPAGIACGAACSADFASGAPVTLAAAAEPGSVFAGWTGACNGVSPTCLFTLSADGTVTATFNLIPGYYAIPPCRVFDSRDPLLGGSGPLANGTDTPVTIAGRCQIAAGASAVSLNVAVTSPSGPGYLTLYPAGVSRPLVTNLNFSARQTRANNALVRLGAGGEIVVYARVPAGSTHVVIDVGGYFAE